MRSILLSVLGIGACTTLSLFAAKSDNVCPKCKAQSQVAAYDDDEEEGDGPSNLPSEPAAPTLLEQRKGSYNAPPSQISPVQRHVDMLENMTPRQAHQHMVEMRRKNPALYNQVMTEFKDQHQGMGPVEYAKGQQRLQNAEMNKEG